MRRGVWLGLLALASCSAGVEPAASCAGSRGGAEITWELNGVRGSGCSDAPLSTAEVDRSRALVGIETVVHSLSMDVAVTGAYPPDPICGSGFVTLVETDLTAGAHGSVVAALSEPVDGASQVHVSAATCPGGPLRAQSGSWRVWRGGSFGDELSIELRDVQFEPRDGQSFRIVRLVWSGRITSTPAVRGPPGTDSGPPRDAGAE